MVGRAVWVEGGEEGFQSLGTRRTEDFGFSVLLPSCRVVSRWNLNGHAEVKREQGEVDALYSRVVGKLARHLQSANFYPST